MIELPKVVFKQLVFKILNLLTSRDKFRLKILFVFQILSSLLDLLGIFLIGLIGSLTINGIQSKNNNSSINSFIEIIGLSNFSLQAKVSILGIFTAFVFICRTFLTLYFTKKTLNFLSHRSAVVSGSLLHNVLHTSPDKLASKTVQEIVFASTYGIDSMIIRVIGSIIVAFADMFFLVVIFLGLFIYSPNLSLTVLLVFGGVSYATYKTLHRKSYELGKQSTELNMFGNSKISEALNAFRELYVRNRIQNYSEVLRQNRNQLAGANASAALLPNISKYIIEGAVVLGTLLVAAILFAIQDANSAISGMAIYLAAASRVAPSALRIQQSFLTIKNNIGAAESSLALIDLVSRKKPLVDISDDLTRRNEEFVASIKVRDVNFKFDSGIKNVISNLNFEIEEGKMLAIVGPSGSGKSTIIDLILGILEPQSGSIEMSGYLPRKAIKYWPGLVSYVPQNISIFKGTLKDNVLIGYNTSDVSQEAILSAVKNSGLDNFVTSGSNGIDIVLSENGSNISGGQKQKIGIARALLTQPKIIILDEATSSLDSTSEEEIMNILNNLRGNVTLVIVAHRLSTVKNADKIIYLDAGGNATVGDFGYLVDTIPDFKAQTRLFGL